MKILLLGASSWIGHYFVSEVIQNHQSIELIGTYSKHKPDQLKTTVSFDYQSDDIRELLNQYQPETIVNMLRGENDQGFKLHQTLIDYGNQSNSYYAYLSSFNACDAQLERDHHEDEQPRAHSDYGKFKAKCEIELNEKSKNYCVFRFAATHSFAPNRIARTEEFLKKLKVGETVKVARGILQNRTFTPHLVQMMLAIILSKGQGVFHLGAIKPSEEIDFLRSLARVFGYSESLVLEEGEIACNANMIPEKLFELCENQYRKTDEDLLKELVLQKELQKYIKR